MRLTAPRRFSPSRYSFLLVAALICFGASTANASTAPIPASPASTAPAANASATTVHEARPEIAPIQFADDIIRRLRRMGINFCKSRLIRPYGLEGPVC